MVNLDLDNKFKIRSDNLQFLLIERSLNREKVVGYFATIQGAIEGYINLKIRLSQASNINELLACIKTLQTRLNKSIAPLQLECVSKKEEKNGN